MKNLQARLPFVLVDSVLDRDDRGEGHPGEASFYVNAAGQRAGFIIRCPGCNVPQALAFRGIPGATGATWEWDGNAEQPTLTPSVHHVGCWHGWLTAGQWVPC